MNVLFFFLLLLFTVALAVHVGQLLEPRTPAVKMIEILFVVLCDQFQTLKDGDIFFLNKRNEPDAREDKDPAVLPPPS